MRGEGRNGGTSLLAMRSHGWVTLQNASRTSGFAGITKHPADNSETQTQLFLILPVLQ